MDVKKLALIMIIIVVSLIGFCVENVFGAYSSGIMTNRNMIFPFLLGYGLAILGFYLLFGTPDSPMFFKKPLSFSSSFGSLSYYFVIAFVAVCIGELILGHFIEWSCGIVWWNYSNIPLHVTKYTSVPTSFAFALMITVFMKFFFNPLLNGFSKMNPHALAIISITLIVLISADFIHSGIYMFKNHEILKLWEISFKKSLKQMIAELI